MTPDFQVKEISLVKLFETWETLREIQADNPPTTLALYRLLLAMLHRAYQGPRNEDHWEEIFEDNGQGAIAYLNQWRDRLDLLHPDHPFMQDPILPLDKAVPIYALHTMSTSQVFSHEHKWSGYSISLSQAARLLVRLQGVDITSLRAFYVGQSSGNRSAVNTPTINAANVLVRGSTLKQTLMFNLMRYDPAAEMPSVVTGEDLPTWETSSYAGKPKKAAPQGYISYLTFPWRRLRLFPDHDEVSQVAITMGNSLPDKVSDQQWECGIAYREDKPVRLWRNAESRQLWRNADAFLLTTEKQHRPRIVDWLADLKSEDLVDDVVTFQIFELSADKAKPLSWSWESFSAPIQYVTDADLAQTLKSAIAIAESHQQVFRSFKGSPYFALAEVLKNGDPSSLANALDGESRYWATLDRAFPQLLNALPQDSHTEANGITYYGNQELPAWTQTVQNAARQAFTESIVSILTIRCELWHCDL
ncbi:type I-E CRISPR-associated protein Cse1/CasA [Synechococcus sp. Nb3U1]|uniref:type I-E CRISPR-associated protein Cse1/CasA n=1 Tax=Synechococcus sp. Nb3U1 TaxID=1914529 RepID=UPI001F1C6374|nr:type I-E CRISPR-associated protein Cse1/CasA [Synechococcus sp. Nb3U1]MCF2970926.1 type I-E CRISPR-associated protein Cse1/CasA [Synechococcus sp. Nb3U1]